MKPRCYNRPPFKDTAEVQLGWGPNCTRVMAHVSDPMSKGCQQHSPLGEATLHPEDWDCAGCCWKPAAETPMGELYGCCADKETK